MTRPRAWSEQQIVFATISKFSHNDALALTYFGGRSGRRPPLESRCADTTADAPALTCVCPSVRPTDTCLPLGGGWPPPGDPLAPSPPPVLVVAVTCVAPNAMSTVCPSLPVRSCCRVRGHRPSLALLDGACRPSRAKSRTLLPKLTVPYIYFFFDTMLSNYELFKRLPLKSLSSTPAHMCTALTARRPPMVTINEMCRSVGQTES